ncbi:hypothetical protein ACFXHA_28135 [Nocardia sp. NPDC059240]|uniref:hypothetical protein n=1 Tax=Nocardia sp. NPDC059240 TaxID=3346786 RepID=UPI003691D6A4
MGASVSWIAVRGKDSAVICQELGLERTGEWSDSAELPFSGARTRDGWYLVVDDRGDQLEEMLDLPAWSAGCEVIKFGVVEGAGYSGIEGWADGRQVWLVEVDTDGESLLVTGELPAAAGALRERLRPDPADDNAVDLPIYLAEALVGYSYCMGLNSSEPEPFEVLQPPVTGDLLTRFTTGLTEVLAELGFARVDPPDPDRRWFTAAAPIPGMQLAVAAELTRIANGGIRIDGYGAILSEPGGALLRELPAEAVPDGHGRENLLFGEIDRLWFGQVSRESTPYYSGRVLSEPAAVDGALEWFMEYVTGPLAEFFATTADPDSFLAAARKPDGYRRISARRVRGTVAWALLHDHADAASALTSWYLRPYRRLGVRRFGFDRGDSHDRAKAFDQALRQRFPDYDRLRQ